MTEVFNDVSAEGLARANQLSLEGQWVARGRGPGCEVYDGPDMLRVYTGVPSLSFNCVVRVQLTRLAVGVLGFVEPALIAKEDPQVVVSKYVVRVQLDRRAVGLHGLARTAARR